MMTHNFTWLHQIGYLLPGEKTILSQFALLSQLIGLWIRILPTERVPLDHCKNGLKK